MANYQKMYSILFNEMNRAMEIIKQAQCQAEELYISSEDEDPAPEEEKE